MKRFSLTKLFSLFLFLCSIGIKAQTDTKDENLMNALKANDHAKALILVKDVNDLNRRFGNNITLLLASKFSGYTDV